MAVRETALVMPSAWFRLLFTSMATLGLAVRLDSLITEFIHDFGRNNYFCGHRRWILNPWSGPMGFGASRDSRYSSFIAEGLYVVSMDYNHKNDLPEFIAYPPEGYAPSSLVFPRWSFGITDKKANMQKVKIKVLDWKNKKIRIKQYAYKSSGGCPTITWEILGGAKKMEKIKNLNANKPIKVFVYGAVVDGKRKDYSYEVKIFNPKDVLWANDRVG